LGLMGGARISNHTLTLPTTLCFHPLGAPERRSWTNPTPLELLTGGACCDLRG